MKFKVMSSRLRSTIATMLSAAMIATSFTVPVFAEEQVPVMESVETVAEANDPEVSDYNGRVSANLLNAKNVTATYPSDEKGKELSVKFNEEGNVVVKWKAIKGAKYYGIAKISVNADKEPIVLKDYSDKYSQKTFVDTTGLLGGGTYMVVGYDESGTAVSKVVSIAESHIMMVKSTVSGQGVDVYFSAPEDMDTFTYTLERSTKNSFKSGAEVIKLSANGVERVLVGSVPAYVYHDSTVENHIGTSISKKNKRYYRITASLDPKNIKDNDKKWKIGQTIVTKPSKGKSTEIVKYVSPTISGMEVEHRVNHSNGCTGGVWLWFKVNTKAGVDTYTATSSSVYYEIEASKDGKHYSLVSTRKASSVSVGTAAKKGLYGLCLKNLNPDGAYAYRIRARYESKYSDYSAPYTFAFQFYPLDNESVSVNGVGKNAPRFKVTTERCAESYAVYNSVNSFTTISEARAFGEKVLERWTKAAYKLDIKLVSGNKSTSVNQTRAIASKDLKKQEMKFNVEVNNNKSTGAELNIDTKKIKNAGYYAYIVVPKRGDVYGYTEALAMGVHVKSGSPDVLTYSSKNDSSFTIKFNKVSKASSYIVERIGIESTVTALDAVEHIKRDFADSDWSNLEAGFNKDGYIETQIGHKGKFAGNVSLNAVSINYAKFDIGNVKKLEVTAADNDNSASAAKKNTIYMYRFRAVVDGNTSEPNDKYIVAQVGCRKPSISVTPIITNSNVWNYTKSKYQTPSGGSVGQHSVKVTVNLGKDKKNITKLIVTRTGYWFDEKQNNVKKHISSNAVYEFTPGGSNSGLNFKTGGASFKFYDTNLFRGVKYYYTVQAETANGTSLPERAVFGMADTNMSIVSRDYPSYTDKTCNTSDKGMPVATGETVRLYIHSYPEGLPAEHFMVTTSNTACAAIKGIGVEKGYNGAEDLTYIDLTIAGKVNTSSKITVKYNYRKDLKDTADRVLEKTFYVRAE